MQLQRTASASGWWDLLRRWQMEEDDEDMAWHLGDDDGDWTCAAASHVYNMLIFLPFALPYDLNLIAA
jgi:hypothetical protein